MFIENKPLDYDNEIEVSQLGTQLVMQQKMQKGHRYSTETIQQFDYWYETKNCVAKA